MPPIWKYTFAILLAAVILVFVASFSLTDSRLHLVFCDVGQGDATLIYRGSVQILVDSGPDTSVLTCLSRHMPFWDRKIELLVLSHAELDHYAGLVDVVRRYQIVSFAGTGVGKEATGFKTLVQEIEKRKIEVMHLEADKKLKLGEVGLSVLWPTKDWLARTVNNELRSTNNVLGVRTRDGSLNEFSLVLRLGYGEFDALLTGDIVPPATDIVAEYFDTRLHRSGWLEVLKVPHHGSKNGLTERLLKAVQPKLAVISVGKNNRYKHPHKTILEMLSQAGVRTLRTDLDGEVEIITDGKTWQILQ